MSIRPFMQRERIAVDPIYLSVAFIELYSSSSRMGSATGFFYRHNGTVFLVTNRHVVIEEETGYYPDRLRMRLHTNPNNVSESDWCDVSLFQGGQKTWLEHPTLRCDLAFIELDPKLMGRFLISPFGKENLLPEDMTISLGDPLIVLGFPLGFYDHSANLPIARRATLGSPYPVSFQGEPYFLIESRLHKGTSGAPVLYLPRGMALKGGGVALGLAGNYLLGVHSEGFEPGSAGEPFDLNTCWFAEIIEDALNRLRPPAPPIESQTQPTIIESSSGDARVEKGPNSADPALSGASSSTL